MRIYKKLFSCLALFLLCIVCLLADAPKVRAVEFLTADDGTFLYMNSRELAISDEEEGVQFFLADDGRPLRTGAAARFLRLPAA